MSSTETTVHEASLADRLDLFKRQHEYFLSEHAAERRRRPKYEAILVITCLLAVSYTYPVESFDKNPVIEIPAISLKIPLRDAIAVFPTIIASLYLIYLSAALRETTALRRFIESDQILQNFQETGKLDLNIEDPFPLNTAAFLVVPTPLQERGGGGFSLFGAVSRVTVVLFVGLIFNVLPYAAVGFITYRSWSVFHSYWIVGWDITCMVAMVLSFLSAIIHSMPERE